MSVARTIIYSACLLVCISSQGCQACGDPANIEVFLDEQGAVTIDWQGANAMGLYVVDGSATLPDGPDGMVTGGAVHWVLESTAFPNGFAPPVTYPDLVDDSQDATADHAAAAGDGGPPVCGGLYKIGIVSLTGDVQEMHEWPCEEMAAP